MVVAFSTERKWLRENIERSIMLPKQRRLHIQSNAALWVLGTCLIIGLLPLMIILITASLSSKVYSWALPWKLICVCGHIIRILQLINVSVTFFYQPVVMDIVPHAVSRGSFWSALGEEIFWYVFRWMKHFYHHIPQTKSRDTVQWQTSIHWNNFWFCRTVRETEACFLHIQLLGMNVRLPKIHKSLPEVDFESSRSPAKSESWNRPNLECWAVLLTWQYCR